MGKVSEVNKEVLTDLIAADYVPIISPVACGEDGETFNVNADYAAGAVSGALEAEKLILLSDIKGLYRDINDEDSFIPEINCDKVKEYIEDGTIAGGMIPKMQCCGRDSEGREKWSLSTAEWSTVCSSKSLPIPEAVRW